MKVRIVCEVSDELGKSYVLGDEPDFPEDKAARYIKAGYAVATTSDKKAKPPEAAALADAPEHASLPPAQKRGA